MNSTLNVCADLCGNGARGGLECCTEIRSRLTTSVQVDSGGDLFHALTILLSIVVIA